MKIISKHNYSSGTKWAIAVANKTFQIEHKFYHSTF